MLLCLPEHIDCHPTLTKPCVAFNIQESIEIINCSHPDLQFNPSHLNASMGISIKDLLHWGIIDNDCIDAMYDPLFREEFSKIWDSVKWRQLKYHDDIRSVPISRMTSALRGLNIIPKHNLQQFRGAAQFFAKIEKNGVCVDISSLPAKHNLYKDMQNNIFYPNYNLYTVTGRPSSNSHYNFLAMEKGGKERQAIKSRFNNGFLLELDFRAYHLSLISNLLKLCDNTFLKDPYGYIATQELGVKNPTKDQKRLAKQTVFVILYGKSGEVRSDLLQGIIQFRQELYQQYKQFTHPQIPIIDWYVNASLSSNALFNYFMQHIETMNSINVGQQLTGLLKDKQSKMVLYMYDSFLFDIHPDDKDIIWLLLSTISQNRLSVTMKIGKNYGNMQEVDI